MDASDERRRYQLIAAALSGYTANASYAHFDIEQIAERAVATGNHAFEVAECSIVEKDLASASSDGSN